MTYRCTERISPTTESLKENLREPDLDPRIAKLLLEHTPDLNKFARIIATIDVSITHLLFEAIDEMKELATGKIETSQTKIVILGLITQLKITRMFLSSTTQSNCENIINELKTMVTED